jgi:hypothetical protein
MNIQLIKGHFTAKDALDIITRMVHEKIKYHESKIAQHSNEEDSKHGEKRIKQLQKELYDIRRHIELRKDLIDMDCAIEIG